MTFEEKFVQLARPFFELSEPVDNAPDEKFEKYFELEDNVIPLLAGLTNLAQGDPAAMQDLVLFFTDEANIEYLTHPNARSFLKILALASNITSDTWSQEVAGGTPFGIEFLAGDDQIDQSFSASGVPLSYYFYNSGEAKNSVALVDFRSEPDVTKLGAPEVWSPQGQDLVEAWSIILLLENVGQVESCVAVVSSGQTTEKAVAYLKYHLVMSGKKLTLPVLFPVSNLMADIQPELKASTDYTQFSEPFSMLSEVNSCDSILDTFLSSYHVLENYMIRSEVASVLSKTTGRSFQRVRDFKRLGQQTDASEVSHLTKLFKQCWDTTIGSDRLSTSLVNSFNDTKTDGRWDVANFDEFLVHLGVLNSKGGQVSFAIGFNNNDSVQINFAKLVYSIRCSIVHNKATEFHLSNEELRRKNIRELVIVKMCLPVMQRLAFGLPSSVQAANPIHYEKRELQFY